MLDASTKRKQQVLQTRLQAQLGQTQELILQTQPKLLQAQQQLIQTVKQLRLTYGQLLQTPELQKQRLELQAQQQTLQTQHDTLQAHLQGLLNQQQGLQKQYQHTNDYIIWVTEQSYKRMPFQHLTDEQKQIIGYYSHFGYVDYFKQFRNYWDNGPMELNLYGYWS